MKMIDRADTVFFSDKQGEGLISDIKEIAINTESKEWTLGNTTFNVGCSITLDGFLNSHLEYVGYFGERHLVFYLGDEANLFETRYFFKVIHWITPKRFFVMYTPDSGRDYNFVDGVWK